MNKDISDGMMLQKRTTDRASAQLKADLFDVTPQTSELVLSPYFTFGCLSVNRVFHDVAPLYSASSMQARPAVAVVRLGSFFEHESDATCLLQHWRLLWREFFHMIGSRTPNFNKMAGNPYSRCVVKSIKSLD